MILAAQAAVLLSRGFIVEEYQISIEHKRLSLGGKRNELKSDEDLNYGDENISEFIQIFYEQSTEYNVRNLMIFLHL